MAFNRKLLVTTALCASAVLGLSACGGSGDEAADPFKDLTPKQISERAEKATKAADSLKVKGTTTEDGEKTDLTFAVSKAGDCEGTIGSKGAQGSVVSVDGSMYIKGDEAFWKAENEQQGGDAAESDAMIEMLKGRWMKVPNEQGSKEGMAGACDLDDILKDTDKGGSGKITRGEDTEVDGEPVATLVKKDGEETSTAYVAKEGKPYLLKVVVKGGDEPGEMTLSDYDKPLEVKAPPADETVDLQKLLMGEASAA
ncbi:hypothetical protein [Streptomyces sp. NPDC060194]|uniref:hypothetical protein n=1 Tax=Streptomyces sp. NPDC060194 TaxID=3347069 RepID=UPI0036534E94